MRTLLCVPQNLTSSVVIVIHLNLVLILYFLTKGGFSMLFSFQSHRKFQQFFNLMFSFYYILQENIVFNIDILEFIEASFVDYYIVVLVSVVYKVNICILQQIMDSRKKETIIRKNNDFLKKKKKGSVLTQLRRRNYQ